MSSISNKTIDSEINFLALDFGLYPGSKKLHESLLAQQSDSKTITIMDVKNTLMSEADWDEVLENILKAKHCITL